MKQLKWGQIEPNQPIAKIPLLFTFPPVQTLMKELTKLNSPHPYRIAYLGPRWSDSLVFHKKYAPNNYPFDQRNIAKTSSFLNVSQFEIQQTMTHNQFYKNQIFYRAFEGMNPTLNLQQQLIFESRFEGGNLDCVVKVSDNEYDLFLRIDSNTRGNIYWFYFAIKNCPKKQKIKLNICNLTKSDTHYAKNLNPFTSSSSHPQWTQVNSLKTTFKEKKLRYKFLYDKLNIRNFYELSFQIQTKGQKQIKFAYCIPYTYTDLLRDIKKLSSVAQIGSLGSSLTGVNIPLIMIGKQNDQIYKPVLLITGRVHPGESNSSIVVDSLMKHLCFSPQTEYLRKKVITIIIPMLNPDGVILGNSRCGASGKDINREFKSRSKFMFPQVYHLKKLVEKISQTHDLELYLDFHGHSRKKNMFMFGPDYNLTQPQYYKSRVFPKLLGNITNIFRYYSCSYTISNDKKSTARAVMLNEMLIPLVFTVQTSLGFYHDYTQNKTVVFTQQKYRQLGQSVAMALKQYYEENQQYEQFLEAKKKAKQQISQEIKQAALNSAPQPIYYRQKRPKEQVTIQTIQKPQTQKQAPKDIKFFKIFHEINQLEEKRLKEQKVQKQSPSEDESDSHNSEEQFQKQKMKQFSSMVTDCLEEETRRKCSYFTDKINNLKKNTPQKHQKINFKKRKQQKMKQQMILFNEYVQDQIKTRNKRKQIRTESNQRAPRKQDIFQPRNGDKKYSQTHSKGFRGEQSDLIEKINKFPGHHFLDEELDFIPSSERRPNKLNIKMFNFSKMVPRYQQSRQIRILKQPPTIISHFSKSLQVEYPLDRLNQLGKQKEDEDKIIRNSIKKNAQQQQKSKAKSLFPSSFYRIKYHNNQRKRQSYQKQSNFYDFEQQQYTTLVNSARRRSTNHSKRGSESISYNDPDNKRETIVKKIKGLAFY